MGRAAVRHAAGFGWDATVEQTLRVYAAAGRGMQRPSRRRVPLGVGAGALALSP
jgi:hypothetical protein